MQNDYFLAESVLLGNEYAWDQLFDQSNQIVTGFTKKYIRNFQTEYMTCEDIVSEAYSCAFYRLNTFTGQSRFSSWVCGIVKRIIWSENRKSFRREQIYQQYIFPHSTVLSNNPSDILCEMELSKSLWDALVLLDPLESYIIERHVVDEQSFHSLGKTTLMSSCAVKRHYNNALRKYSEMFHRIHHNRFCRSYRKNGVGRI